MKASNIKLGMKFSCVHFSATVEVSKVSAEDNTLDVIMIPSDGNAWEEKGWNLAHTKHGFERGEYKEIVPDPSNISVW